MPRCGLEPESAVNEVRTIPDDLVNGLFTGLWIARRVDGVLSQMRGNTAVLAIIVPIGIGTACLGRMRDPSGRGGVANEPIFQDN